MKSYLSPAFPGWISENSKAYGVIRALNEASSVTEAEEIWNEGQKIMWEDSPVYIAGHYTTSYACSGNLSNIIIQNGFFFWNTVKEKKK